MTVIAGSELSVATSANERGTPNTLNEYLADGKVGINNIENVWGGEIKNRTPSQPRDLSGILDSSASSAPAPRGPIT